ncbi:MAG: response regulator [Glaciecola sp.]
MKIPTDHNKQEKLTLFAQISRQLIPRLLIVVTIFVFIMAVAFILTSRGQVEKQHNNYHNQLVKNIEKNTHNLVTIVKGLAENDLLVNGLIDFQMRDEYLPLFFQNLKISNDTNGSRVLFDYAGDIILSAQWQENKINALAPNWKQLVLQESTALVYIGSEGVLVISPIMFSGQAEGALGMYSPTLSPFIDAIASDITYVITDSNQSVIYDSNQPNATSQYQYSKVKSTAPYQHEHISAWQDMTIVSLQSYSSIYSESLWLLPFLIVSLLASIITSIFGARTAANQASSTLAALYKSLENSITNDEKITPLVKQNEAYELQQIRQQFNILVSQVFALSLNNTKVTNVINSLQELLLVVDENGKVLLENKANQQFFHNFDCSQQDVIAEALSRLNTLDDLRFLSTGTSSGMLQTIQWQIAPFIDEQGLQHGAVLSGENISATIALKKDINVRSQALETSPAAITIADISDPKQPLVYVNSAFCKITGYKKHEVLGRNCNFLQGSATESESKSVMRQAITGGKPCSTVITNYKKDGTAFINSLSLNPVTEADGSIKYYVGVQKDITIEKQSEAYLEKAKTKAEDIAKAQARFFASINHELRTPINGINGMVKALLSSQLTATQRKQAELANQSANNLLLLVNDVLDFSKAESGQLSMNIQRFELSAFCNDLAQVYEVQCNEKQIAFSWQGLPNTPIYIESDKLRLQQIIDNLFSNALKFTDKGNISVTTAISEHSSTETINTPKFKLSVSIKDTGIGIQANQIDTIFKMFGQVESSTRKITSGTGLGLNISKLLVNIMGGSIDVNSVYHEGSEFSFFVMVDKCDQATPSQSAQRRKCKLPHGARPPVVLIVEDNEINQQVVIANLPKSTKLLANNGLQALDILNKAKVSFDLILMDCQMPELDGWDTTRLIRSGHAGEHYKDIPIIALTAYTSASDQQACSDAGMDDYLSKPFEPQKLIETVNKWTAIRRNY